MSAIITGTPAQIQAVLTPPAVIAATLQPPAAIAARLAVGQGPSGPAGSAGSTRIAFVASVGLSGHVVLALDEDGEAIPASADTPAHASTAVGISTDAATAGAEVIACGSGGTLEHSGWTFTPDGPVYLGLAGALVQTLPFGALFSKVIGRALSPTLVLVSLQPAVFLAS